MFSREKDQVHYNHSGSVDMKRNQYIDYVK